MREDTQNQSTEVHIESIAADESDSDVEEKEPTFSLSTTANYKVRDFI